MLELSYIKEFLFVRSKAACHYFLAKMVYRKFKLTLQYLLFYKLNSLWHTFTCAHHLSIICPTMKQSNKHQRHTTNGKRAYLMLGSQHLHHNSLLHLFIVLMFVFCLLPSFSSSLQSFVSSSSSLSKYSTSLCPHHHCHHLSKSTTVNAFFPPTGSYELGLSCSGCLSFPWTFNWYVLYQLYA